jgi:hypothetical protein
VKRLEKDPDLETELYGLLYETKDEGDERQQKKHPLTEVPLHHSYHVCVLG